MDRAICIGKRITPSTAALKNNLNMHQDAHVETSLDNGGAPASALRI